MKWKFWEKEETRRALTIYHVEEIIPDPSGGYFVYTDEEEFQKFLGNNFTSGDIYYLPNNDKFVIAGNVTYHYRSNEKTDNTYFG